MRQNKGAPLERTRNFEPHCPIVKLRHLDSVGSYDLIAARENECLVIDDINLPIGEISVEDHRVITVSTTGCINAGDYDKRVVATAPEKNIIALSVDQAVVAHTSTKFIIASGTEQFVISTVAENQIIGVATSDDVIAPVTIEGLLSVRLGQSFVCHLQLSRIYLDDTAHV